MFNPFYEKNRLQYAVAATEDPLTLADQLRDENDLPKKHGFMLEGGIEWQRKLRIGVRYDTEGIDRAHWVLFRLELSPVPGYHLSGFFAGQDLTGGSDLFGPDNLIGLALRGRVHGPVDLFFHFTRRLRRQGPQIRHANELGGGAGVSVSY
jgi:hypothetical protein